MGTPFAPPWMTWPRRWGSSRTGRANAEPHLAAKAMADRPGRGAADQAIFETQAAFILLELGDETDLGRIDAAVERLRGVAT